MIVAALVHFASATLIAYLLATIFGHLTSLIAIVSLVVSGWLAWKSSSILKNGFGDLKWPQFSSGPQGWVEKSLFAFLMYVAFRHFAWMFYEHSGEYRTLSVNNFGDLPLHINYIRQFAYGAHFPPVNPEFALEPLRYPLGVDLYSALWEILKVPTASHFFVVGLAATYMSLVVLRALGGWLAVGGFFLNGGLIGLGFAGRTLPAGFEQTLAWKNILLTVFITQRGVLLALPIGVVLILFIQRLFSNESFKPTKLHYLIFGGLWGSLAIFHLHSFVAVSLILFLLAAFERREGLTAFVKLLVPALPIGTFFVLYSTGFFKKASILHWQVGWMKEKMNFIPFAFLNFGVWPVFFILVALLIAVARPRTTKAENNRLLFTWLVGIGLFALFLNLMLAPWAWDNIKVLVWPYILLLAVSSRALNLFFAKGPLAIVHVLLSVMLLTPGFKQVMLSIRGTMGGVGIYQVTEVAKTAGATKNLPINSVIAAAATHNHPLTSLGRIRALGYDGHLWSHGIEYSKQTDALRSLMTGTEDWKKSAEFIGATHIFWGPMERQAFGEVPERLKSQLKNSSSVTGYEVYELPKN